jgi:hypothetical protein
VDTLDFCLLNGIKILPVLFVERILSITKQRERNDFDAFLENDFIF